MEAAISLQDVANIVTFVAPGYFAIQVYSLVYSKRERDFSRLVVESVVYSLPLVFATNLIWKFIFQQDDVNSLNVAYAALLGAVSVGTAWVYTQLRVHRPLKSIAAKWGLDSPHEDFVKAQLQRLDPKDPDRKVVTVTLQDDSVFSGTLERLSRYVPDGQMYYSFADLAWYNQALEAWEEREGNLIIERREIKYIETAKLRDV